MSVSPLALGPASSSGPCAHVRQHHPGSPERILPCAWPGCPVGVSEESLAVSGGRVGRLLVLERRSLVLDGVEQIFLWHPARQQA